MKIGDKVRFLNDVGGGVIAGFPDKDTVLVRDEDGFDIPVLRRECVVVDTNDYNIAKVNTRSEKQPVAGTAQKALHADEEKMMTLPTVLSRFVRRLWSVEEQMC